MKVRKEGRPATSEMITSCLDCDSITFEWMIILERVHFTYVCNGTGWTVRIVLEREFPKGFPNPLVSNRQSPRAGDEG